MQQPGDASRRSWILVAALAIAQICSWGSIYYSFSLFVVPMERELGWDRTEINGAIAIGLLATGLSAYPVGRWIDRHGGRGLMSLGSLAGALLLALWSRTESLTLFYAIWLCFGPVMAATFYDPLFAVLARRFPASYRARITVVTLIAGFASTVFIPLTGLFIAWFGWRDALLALAVANLAIALPIHAIGLRRDGSRGAAAGNAAAAGAASNDALNRALRHPVFWCLLVCFVAYYSTFAALTFHVIPLLVERGFAMTTIIGAVAVVGPAQVAGRLVLFGLGRRVTTADVGRVTGLLFPAAILLLLAAPTSVPVVFGFAALYGAANGVMTIIRGTAVPDLLWREGYGAINGALALPATLAQAASPFVAAVIWTWAGGYDAVLWTILAGSSLSAVGFWSAVALSRRRTPARAE
jgi:sugar phosphate permease